MSVLNLQRAAALPVNHGAYYCGLCWTPPGVAHELSCPEVTPEQFRAFLRGGGFRPHPDAVRNFRGPLVALALIAPFWAAVALIWSL